MVFDELFYMGFDVSFLQNFGEVFGGVVFVFCLFCCIEVNELLEVLYVVFCFEFEVDLFGIEFQVYGLIDDGVQQNEEYGCYDEIVLQVYVGGGFQ